MTDTDRPSIAELQRVWAEMPKGQWSLTSCDGKRATVKLLNAAPVLLEIAAAALLGNGPCHRRCAYGSHFRGRSRSEGGHRMRDALAKVRP
jgi:hypothetical protein